MPSTKGLDLLVGKSWLTDADWIEFLETRRDLLRPYLDEFTLPRLSDLKFPFVAGSRIFDRMYIGPRRDLVYQLQGIFGIFFEQDMAKIYGLTRGGKWMRALVELDQWGYMERDKIELERDVELRHIMAEIGGNRLGGMFLSQTLSEATEGFVERRKELYERVLDLHSTIKTQDLVLSLMGEGKSGLAV